MVADYLPNDVLALDGVLPISTLNMGCNILTVNVMPVGQPRTKRGPPPEVAFRSGDAGSVRVKAALRPVVFLFSAKTVLNSPNQ